MRYRGRGVVMGASLSALVLVASGCTGAEEAEPTPSFASPTADADPSPELTEPPYETELNLTPDEKKAADEAYDVLVEFIDAYNQVAADSGSDPDRALQFTDGELYEKHSAGYAEMAENGEKQVGDIVHRSHHLDQVEISDEADGSIQFESCVDYSQIDVVDADGKSVAAPELEPIVVFYEFQNRGSAWKLGSVEFTDESCS